jgi:hypothetical protein
VGPKENKESLDFADLARCWTALKYTKPRTNGTTPTLRGPPPENKEATSFNDKEALIREIAFPLAPRDMAYDSRPRGTMHQQVTTKVVWWALFSQAIKKAPGVDRLNFRALWLLWS